MELFKRKIPVKHGKPVYIYAISDIQYGGANSGTCLDTLNRYLDEANERDAYFTFTGDAVDAFSPSNRARLAAANLYDSAEDFIEFSSRALCDELYEKALHKMKDRILGWVEGHHWHRFQDGNTTDTYLCSKLRAPFGGTSCLINVQMFRSYGKTANQITGKKYFRESKAHSGSVVLFLHHGVGSGRKLAAPLNRLEDLPGSFDADVFIIGHSSRKVSAPMDFLTVNWGAKGGPLLQHRRRQLVATGAFMRGYEQGRKQGNKPAGSYVEQNLFRPATLGPAIIKITPMWVNNRWSYDLRVES